MTIYHIEAINVSVLKEILLIKEGIDEGSTYLELECDCCKEIIGKTYKSTTNVTDQIRNMFSFHMEKIKTHVLGSCSSTKRTEKDKEISKSR